jgi:hypothetical protein
MTVVTSNRKKLVFEDVAKKLTSSAHWEIIVKWENNLKNPTREEKKHVYELDVDRIERS